MEKIIYNGETFYFDKGTLYDGSFLAVPINVANKVLAEHYKKIDYTVFEEDEYFDHLKHLKASGFYGECMKAIEYGLKKFSSSRYFYSGVFPILTSCYRALGTPQKAVDFWMENKAIFVSCLSVPLLTSLAAAYCDLGNYALAKKCADRAYAMQGGGVNYQTELSLVYGRIKKATKGR